MSGFPLNVGSISHELGFNETHKYSLECSDTKNCETAIVSAHYEAETFFIVGTSSGCSLSIARFKSGRSSHPEIGTPFSEHILEFDNCIDALCFDPSGKCLIASDDRGYLHFVAVGDPCSLIFSHKTPIAAGSKLMVLKFFPNASAPTTPLMVGVRDNGVYYSVSLPVAAVLKMAVNQPEALSTAVSKLVFASMQLSLPYPKKALLSMSTFEDCSISINVFILDAYNHAHHALLNVAGKTVSMISLTPLHGPGAASAAATAVTSCVDVALLDPGGGTDNLLVLLGSEHEVCCFGAQTVQWLFGMSLDLDTVDADDCLRIIGGCVHTIPEISEVDVVCIALTLCGESFVNSYAAVVNLDSEMKVARLFQLHSSANNGEGGSYAYNALGSHAGSSVSNRYIKCQGNTVCANEPVVDFTVFSSSIQQAHYLSALLSGFAAAASNQLATVLVDDADLSDLYFAKLIGVCSNVSALSGSVGEGAVLIMRHLEELCSTHADALGSVGSSLAAMVELLLDLPALNAAGPSAGFRRLVSELKHCVDIHSPIRHDECQIAMGSELILGYYLYCSDTALKVSSAASTNAVDVSLSEYLKCFHSIIKTSPMQLWEQYLCTGSFAAAAVVRARHLHGVAFQPGSLLKAISNSVDSKLLLEWVQGVLVPYFFQQFNARGYQDGTLQAQLELSVQEVLRRAELLEARQKHPFDAILYCEVAAQLVSLVAAPVELVAGSTKVSSLSGQVAGMMTLLKQSAFMRQHYMGVSGSTTANKPDSGHKYSFYSLKELGDIGGLQGLMFQLFDSTGVQYHDDDADSGLGPGCGAIPFDLGPFLQGLSCEFGASYDDMCLRWIDDTVNNKVLALSANVFESRSLDLDASYQSRASDSTDEGFATPVALMHLLAVACSISDPFQKAKAMLLLLQVPANTTAAAITARLYDIAEGLLAVLGGTSLGDSLQEAVRSYKLSNITARYNVTKLNLRDKRQVKAAAYVIASRWQQQYVGQSNHQMQGGSQGEHPSVVFDQSICDAVAFVTSRNAGGIELCAVLARGILLRILDFPTTSCSVSREDVIANALKQVPSHCLKVVAENVCTHLVQEMDSYVELLAELGAPESDDRVEVQRQNRQKELRLGWWTATSGLITTLSTYLDIIMLRPLGSSWCSMELLNMCKNLRALYTDSDLVVSLKQIQDEEHCKTIVCGIAGKQANVLVDTSKESCATGAALQLLTTEQRRCCGILNVSCVYFLFELANNLIAKKEIRLAIAVALAMNTEKRASTTAPGEVREVYRGGVLANDGTSPAMYKRQELYRQYITRCKEEADLILSTATAFCMNSTKLANKEVGLVTLFNTARELLKNLAINCPQKYIGSTMDYFVITDLVLAVHDRFDSSASASASVSVSSSGDVLSILNGSLYVKDGILLSSTNVLMPLLKFCLKEIQRRNHTISSLHTGTADSSSIVVSGAPPAPGAGTSLELMDLLTQLHKSENHVLAVRVLLTSWHLDCNKYSYIYASLKALTRKILTYREIDMELAVAYLGSIPDKSMVKELQSIIPTVQNDFTRLKLTALIGEQLALMWDKEDLLRVFQSLQNNAKWWSALSGYGIKVDTKTFQHPVGDIRSQYIRSIVPQLLERSHMDLELAQDYCRQFDLTTEFANTCFIELILESASTADSATAHERSVNSHKAWEKHVRFAVSGVSQEQMLATFRGLLKKVHQYSYGKIKYVCKWLMSYLQEESEVSGDYSKLASNFDASSTEIKNKVPFGTVFTKPAIPIPESPVVPDPEISKEIQLYQRYIDIIDTLTVLKIPAHILSACSFDMGRGVQNRLEDVESGSQSGSIPLWQLIDEPWGILDSLLQGVMSSASGASGDGSGASNLYDTDLAVLNNSLALKLSSLCPLLLVDGDVYHSKRIKLFYGKYHNQNGGGDSESLVGSIKDNVQLIKDPLSQMKLWLWVYEQEVGGAEGATSVVDSSLRPPTRLVTNSRLSQVALDHAVILVRQLEEQTQMVQRKPKGRTASVSSSCGSEGNTRPARRAEAEEEDAELNLLIEVHQMKIDVQLLAVRSKCRTTVRNLIEASIKLVEYSAVKSECLACLNNLYNYVHSPKDLLTMLYCSALVEVSWILQLNCMTCFEGNSGLGSTHSNTLTVFEVMNSGLCAATTSFLQSCGRAVDEIQQVVALVEVASKAANKSRAGISTSSVSGTASSGLSTSDSIRHAVVSKYLSEFHYSNVTHNANSGVSAGGGGVERLGGMVYSGTSSVASFGGISGSGSSAASADSSVCAPTAAERRRSEDIFAGFCISVLICSCVDLGTRNAFISQLDNVIKDLRASGGSTSSSQGGSSKRIASRSKFRSALALRYIHNCASTTNLGGGSSMLVGVDAVDQNTASLALLQYLYCLCELQETRLGTPVETLTQILLPQTAREEQKSSGLSAKSVVNTWLYDEGDNEDVLELCRDIYIASGCRDVAMWVQLLMKMFNNSQYHIMLTTLSMLHKYTFLETACAVEAVGTGTVKVEDSSSFIARLCLDGGGEFVNSVLQMLASVIDETTTAMQQTFDLLKYQKQQASSIPVTKKGKAAGIVTGGEEEGADYVPETATVPQQRHVFSSLVPYFASVTPAPTTDHEYEGLKPLVIYTKGVNNLSLDHVVLTLTQTSSLLSVITELLEPDTALQAAPILNQIAVHYRQLLQWGVRADLADISNFSSNNSSSIPISGEGEKLLFTLSWNASSLVSRSMAVAFCRIISGTNTATECVSAFCSQALKDVSVVLQSPTGEDVAWRLYASLCDQIASPREMFLALDLVLLASNEVSVGSIRALTALLRQCICHGGCTTSARNRTASEVLISWCVQSFGHYTATSDACNTDAGCSAKKILLQEAFAAVMRGTVAETDCVSNRDNEKSKMVTGRVQLQQQLTCVMDVLAVNHLSDSDRKVLRELFVAVTK